MLRSEATTLLRLFLQNVGTEDAVVGNVNSDIKCKQLIGNKVTEYTF